jgi:hypothetical protein
MLGFMSDELVWAVVKEREGDARKVRPHTEAKPDERQPNEHAEHHTLGVWLAPHLRAGATGAP